MLAFGSFRQKKNCIYHLISFSGDDVVFSFFVLVLELDFYYDYYFDYFWSLDVFFLFWTFLEAILQSFLKSYERHLLHFWRFSSLLKN